MKDQKHTYNLGIIGNCSYLALIDKQASVKWLCWPKFDSSFIFGNLLDDEKGGEFSVKPKGDGFQTEQYYVENTNVLCTEFSRAMKSSELPTLRHVLPRMKGISNRSCWSGKLSH